MGLLESIDYLSSTGSGKIKKFNRLTVSGLYYGINEGGDHHDEKTTCRFYQETFKELVTEIAQHIIKESVNIKII